VGSGVDSKSRGHEAVTDIWGDRPEAWIRRKLCLSERRNSSGSKCCAVARSSRPAAVGAAPVGRVVIGTVKGGLHDIGKNLVASMLEGHPCPPAHLDLPLSLKLIAKYGVV
jgi:methanogenic corrinoid protein MtbC1